MGHKLVKKRSRSRVNYKTLFNLTIQLKKNCSSKAERFEGIDVKKAGLKILRCHIATHASKSAPNHNESLKEWQRILKTWHQFLTCLHTQLLKL